MNDDFIDFMINGGDEVLNNYECPACGHVFNDAEIEWADENQSLVKCPKCKKIVEISK